MFHLMKGWALSVTGYETCDNKNQIGQEKHLVHIMTCRHEGTLLGRTLNSPRNRT